MSETYQLVILGEDCVEKVELVARFLQKTVEDCDPRSKDFFKKERVIDNIPAQIDVLNTLQLEGLNTMRDQAIRNGDGCLLVFLVNDYSSFAKIQIYHQLVLRIKDCDEFPMVIVGNTTKTSNKSSDDGREVSTESAQAIADAFGIPYVECNGETGINIEEAFDQLVRSIRKFRQAAKTSRKMTRKTFCIV